MPRFIPLLALLLSGCTLIGGVIGSSMTREESVHVGYSETPVPETEVSHFDLLKLEFRGGTVIEGKAARDRNSVLTLQGRWVDASLDSLVAAFEPVYETRPGRRTTAGLLVGVAIDVLFLLTFKPWTAPF